MTSVRLAQYPGNPEFIQVFSWAHYAFNLWHNVSSVIQCTYRIPNSSMQKIHTSKYHTSKYIIIWAMAKIGYTQKPDGQNKVPPSTLVPGRKRIGQRPPRPDSSRISNGSARFWLLTPPSTTRFQSHLPDYGRTICTLFIFSTSKKIHQLKNYIIIAPPQHGKRRFFLDVDSF